MFQVGGRKMIEWIDNNLYTNPTARMGRPVAASATHTPLSFTCQWAAIIIVASLLLSATVEAWF
jgi:hypothetical protein